ncbi:MAG: 30S ribosomal protein S9 [Candidatus Aenigmarchaeota archaeon]|nr:30S ribosomal protein S9 [Candidatus Aenigmarchaeota archaeon]
MKQEAKPFTTGKRKRAVARAWITKGTGIVKVNAAPLETLTNDLVRMKIREPLILAGDATKGFDIHVSVRGGGIMGQADAVRQAITRALISQVPTLKERFMHYDRFMVVYDPRRTEPHKPPRSSQGPRRHKQRSKR